MPSSPVWHPFTQAALEPPVTPIASTDGCFLYTGDGTAIIDAISSWWVITHRHRHPAIVEAVAAAANRLDQVIFAGFTHEPAERLARKLVSVAPRGLEHVFFSESGSAAVEIGVKMALGFHRNMGAAGRSKIIVLEHGYHGDTIGAMSLGARGTFTAAYEPLLFEVARIPFPAKINEQATLDAFEAHCRGADAAALLIEPLVLGAGGMHMYEPHVLRELHRIAQAHGVLMIADEVMTGWGRTGTLFACEQAGITPDILCTSKGLTGGMLPLAATLATAPIHAAHFAADRARMFFHSSSFCANPIACSAALANVDIWEKEPVRERVATLAARQAARLSHFENDLRVRDVRRTGTITALDLAVDDGGYLAGVALDLRAFFRERGVLIRPLGNTIYVLPPYCIEPPELDAIYTAIDDAATRFTAPCHR